MISLSDVHGTFISIIDHGLLITGAHGCGKSELALGLVDRGHQLVADDSPIMMEQNGRLLGRSPKSYKGCLHIHGTGILNISRLYGAQAIKDEATVELCIHLTRESFAYIDDELLHGKWGETIIHKIAVPTLTLPSSTTRNLPLLVEAAVRQRLDIHSCC